MPGVEIKEEFYETKSQGEELLELAVFSFGKEKPIKQSRNLSEWCILIRPLPWLSSTWQTFTII